MATKIAIDEYGAGPLTIGYCVVRQEHEDNERFLQDCEKWYGRPVRRLINEKYDGDIFSVFDRVRYLVGPKGAACTRLLKKEVRRDFEKPRDRQVFGFTYEEIDRYNEFIDANNIDVDVPLIRHKLTKKDCLGILAKANIEIPMMYRLGYKNNNCIGCVKGGAGYWNKIRVDFPDAFERMAQMEEKLGRTINVDRIGGTRKRISLRELKPDAGRYFDEPDIECGVACLMASFDYGDACDDL